MNQLLRSVSFSGFNLKRITLGLLLLMMVGESWGQIVAWDFNGQTGTVANGFAPTTANTNLSIGGLTRGSALGAVTLANAFSSNNFTAQSAALAISNSNFISFTVKSNTGFNVSLTTINANFRISNATTSPINFQWQYSIDGINFFNIGSVIAFSNTTTNGVAQTPVDLSAISSLQNVNDATTITIRLLCWGTASIATGSTFALGRLTGDDLSVSGSVSTACAAPTLTSASSSNINTVNVDLGANITNTGGGATITERGVQYSTSSTLASSTTNSETGSFGTGSYTRPVSGLTENTLYYYRGYAINDCATPQTGYTHTSGFPTFTTVSKPPTSPTANTPTAGGFTASWTAPSGQGVAALTYTVTVFTDAAFTNLVSTVPSIATTSTTIAGLNPSTTYYYRVVAVNAGGNSTTADFTSGITTLARPTVTLFTSNPSVVAGDIFVNTTNNVVYLLGIDVAAGTSSAVLTGLQVTTGGTYLAADLTNLKAWYSTDNSFNSGVDVLLSTLTNPGAAGLKTFSFTAPSIAAGSTGYIFITADVPCSATLGNNLNFNNTTQTQTTFAVNPIYNPDNTFGGGLKTFKAGTPNDVTALTAIAGTSQVTVSWTAPTGCYDEVIIVAHTASITGTPTGTYTAASTSYTNLSNPAFPGGGVVVYNGTTSPQTITSLTNGTLYYFKVFARKGTVWSSGVQVSATPVLFTYAAGDYRPLSAGVDFSWNNNWETFNGTSWVIAATAPQNLAPASRPSRIVIDKIGITAGGSSSNTYNDIVILSGGELYLVDNSATPTAEFINANKSIEVKSGGLLYVDGDIDMPSSGNLIVRNGGDIYIAQNSITNTHPMWDGTELFEGGSYFIVWDWNWGASPSSSSLLNANPTLRISANANGYRFGNLIIDAAPTTGWTLVGGSTGVINLCENNLEVNNTSTNYIYGHVNATGTNGFVVNGDMIIYDGAFAFGTSFTSTSFSHQFTINGNFTCASNDALKMHLNAAGTATALTGFVTFKGNVTIASTVSSFSSDAASNNTRVYADYSGGTSSSPLYLDIAPVATAISMNVKTGAYVRLKNQDLTTNSLTSNTAIFTVESNATFHFGWSADGTTPLVLKKTTTSPAGTNQFASAASSTLIITSLAGLQQASATTGNVQFTTANKSFNQVATFWYVGKGNQVTGDGITNTSAARTIICDLIDNNTQLTFSNSTSITAPGLLNIQVGRVIETTTEYITGSTGGLTMATGTYYQIPSLSASGTDLLPRLDGISSAYSLTGGTIELNGAGSQVLRGNRAYRNLTFSNSGTKTLASGCDPAGLVYITGTAIFDQSNNTFGNTGTSLTMDGGRYRLSGTGTKPDIDGTYSLTGGVIEFYNSAGTSQTIKGKSTSSDPINYIAIEVTGSNVAQGSANITLQSGGWFTIKNGGIFTNNADAIVGPTGNQTLTIETGGKFVTGNTLGFYGALSGFNSPSVRNNIETFVFQTNSTVEYSRSSAQSLTPAPVNYKNLIISGGGTKTLTGAVTTEEILTLTSGLVTTSNANLLTLANTASVAGATFASRISGGSDNSFVNGPMKKIGNSDFLFPVGKPLITSPAVGGHRYIGISGLSSVTDEFIAEFFVANATALGPIVAPASPTLVNVSRCEYWRLDKGGSAASANVTLSWRDRSNCNVTYVTKLSTLVVAHNTSTAYTASGYTASSGNWDSYGNDGGTTGDVNAGSVTWNNVTSFSPFSLGSINQNDNPLPFLLNTFNAKPKSSAIQLDWAVGNNHQQQQYILERGANAQVFETITTVNAKQGTTAADYVYDDAKPLNGWNYYRLRAIDKEGKSNSSSIIKVWWGKGATVNVLPNPATEKIVINLSEPSSIKEIQIVNAMGQVMRKITTVQFFNEVNISSMQAGIYYIRFLGENGLTTRSFVKQ